MRIKSYFTKSVDEGIAQAREELGEDALLLKSRKLEKGANQPGAYEVVFGIVETKGPTLVPGKQPPPEDAALELERLRRQMDELRDVLALYRDSQHIPGRI